MSGVVSEQVRRYLAALEASEQRDHDYSDSCPCSSCSRVRRRLVEPRTGQATDQGSR